MVRGFGFFHLMMSLIDVDVGLSAEHGCYYRHPRKLGINFGAWNSDEELSQTQEVAEDQDKAVEDVPTVAMEGITIASDENANGQQTNESSQSEQVKRDSKGWFALVDSVDLSYREVVQLASLT